MLTAELKNRQGMSDSLLRLRLRQLRSTRQRARLLVRALTSFYLSLGSFAAASFTSLLGAIFVITGHDMPRQSAMLVAFVCGVFGIGGLVVGSLLLVWETRLTLSILGEEADMVLQGIERELNP